MIEKNILEKILLNVNKPSQYTGSEIGSTKKNWNDAKVKVALAFPDKYEIGISNLGLRILYHIVNENPYYLADRVYAPDVDFKEELEKHNLELYGLESKQSLKEFDVIAYSLQYELSYPTLLKMLEMGSVPVYSKDRDESHPIVMAGGPGAYNPESVRDFIDAFMVGDGEELIIEALDSIKDSKDKGLSRVQSLENLAKIKGIYIPQFYSLSSGFKKPIPLNDNVPALIDKRIYDFKNETAPVKFPLPSVASVHDRAVVEIRRGCGRMCRFCQPCFVNLPIRERDANDIISITNNVLEETGYDEYSLLSLSSNDYKGIEKLVANLNCTHAHKGTSVSLPSQRADAFNLELAEEVQKVRKSTITFAAEAGTQRLRDVINKNLTEEQIVKAVTTVYQAGWSSVKLYFMIGLPTETFEDLDEIVALLGRIKYYCKQLKKEFDLSQNLNINCTISIFVPKPFTPFQWCPQDSVATMKEKVFYLKDKIKKVKGTKLSYHNPFLTQLEAVFSKGDSDLNKLIYKAYKKGSYLDAWHEYFNKSLWEEAAKEVGIDFDEYSSRDLSLEDELPWDYINTGVNKDWLVNEYNQALKNTTSDPCDVICSNCGVCSNFNTSKSLNKSEIIVSEPTEKLVSDEKFKYRLKINKTGNLKYVSHLDWFRIIYKAVKKANVDIAFSQGFNPSPKISVGVALPIFAESKDEYVDIELKTEFEEEELKIKLNEKLPKESTILKIVKLLKGAQSVDNLVHWAKYEAQMVDYSCIKNVNLSCAISSLLENQELFIEKKNKKGLLKKINIRPSVHSIELEEIDEKVKLKFILRTAQGNKDLENDEKIVSLRADKFIEVLTPDIHWNITRVALLDENFKELVNV